MNTTDDLLQELKKGECVVTFEKIDTGELREMHCTLNPDLIPNHFELNQSPDGSDLVVWCTDKDDWRSFRVSTMKEWRIK